MVQKAIKISIKNRESGLVFTVRANVGSLAHQGFLVDRERARLRVAIVRWPVRVACLRTPEVTKGERFDRFRTKHWKKS